MEIYDMDTTNYNKEQTPIQAAIDTGSGSDAYGNHTASNSNTTHVTEKLAGAGFTPGSMYPPPRTPQTVRAEIKRTRHKKEVPLYILLILLGFIAVGVILYQETQGEGILAELRSLIEEFLADGISGLEGTDLSTVVGIVLLTIGLIFGIGSLIALVVIMLAAMYSIYADQMSYSIRVSERNFPEIYAKVKEYTWLLGLRKEPEVYVQQMNGELNAFTAWVPGKAFIQLNAEIVDLAYMEHKDFEPVYFTMAHEMGHIYLHHVQIYYTIWAILANFIPVIGSNVLIPALSRSREYSSDRVAQALTGGVGQEDCMMLLAAGRHAYKYVDTGDYLRNITANHNAIERFARWCTNLVASHPIMPFRVRAILDPSKKSGRLL